MRIKWLLLESSLHVLSEMESESKNEGENINLQKMTLELLIFISDLEFTRRWLYFQHNDCNSNIRDFVFVFHDYLPAIDYQT